MQRLVAVTLGWSGPGSDQTAGEATPWKNSSALMP
jgi:hypothetical protein